ncbi:ead/Ea22-like family protein [Pseudomonas sp. REB1044]|uniref:ead/Ea22-like family protein n=1 Tax=Pseudomonas sp. REB1044 TaxID=2675224 RepID=UPI00315DF1A9
MNVDKANLKALAEASGFGEWYAAGDLRYCDDKTGEIHGLHHDDSRFIAASSPATVLALLAEIERLTEQNENLLECRSAVNAGVALENEALRKDAERYRAVRRVANLQGFTDELFDQQTDTRTASLDAAMAKEAGHG